MFDYTDAGLKVLNQEIKGLTELSKQWPDNFMQAAHAIADCKGRLVIGGVGKSGYIGQKLAASFASTGKTSFYIHPAEASHGDLGMIDKNDIVMLLSNSGETKELAAIINYCKRFTIPMIGVTMQVNSTLGDNCDFLLNIPKVEEASSVDAPTTSSTMMLALGDALMVAVHEAKGFSKEDYKIYHPGGKLGANMLKVVELMHVGSEIPIVASEELMENVILTITSKRFGCAIVIDHEAKISGIITDGDLRRNINNNILKLTAKQVMTPSPKTVCENTLASEALAIMSKNNVTSLVVTENANVKGILHIHDLLRAGVK